MAKKSNKLKTFIKIIAGCILFSIMLVFIINIYVYASTKNQIKSATENLPHKTAGLILGAKVYPNGIMSHMLEDRVQTTIELYNKGTISKILVSGDHGKTNYDEVNTIKSYLQSKNVKPEDIFLDHAGFDTYDSLYRAKEIFQINDLVIITQEFHLPRALYIANSLKLDAYGVKADKREYLSIKYNELREIPANIKAYIDLVSKAKPKFLGEKIPITGDSKKSWDIE